MLGQPDSRVVLNSIAAADTDGDLPTRLRDALNRVLMKHMDQSSGLLDYQRMRSSWEFHELIRTTAELPNFEFQSTDENHKKAFFLNVYNTLSIHSLIHMANLPKSTLDCPQRSNLIVYRIGHELFSLDDIEHGILRANHPRLTNGQRAFLNSDSRLKYSLCELDPRIHFAKACGAKSAPSLKIYSSDGVNEELNLATEEFCQKGVRVNPKLQMIFLSKIFRWYQNDFGSSELRTIEWVVPYLSASKQRDILALSQLDEKQGGVRIHYQDYDWGLNMLGLDQFEEPQQSETSTC